MPRVSKTKSVDNTTAVKNTAVDVDTTEMDENEEVIKEVSRKTEIKKNTKPLEDSDEIEVMSLVPNVSYKDSKTGDMYEWDEVGHVEYMTFDVLKNMWRNNKGYFRNMLLKPNDDRVINKFGLERLFDKYEFLMDESNYTRAKIKDVCETISSTPNGLKYSICNKLKDLVSSGKITDVSVIRTLEKQLGLDLIAFL